MKIIKLGGSLLSDHNILVELCSFFQNWQREGLLLVPGGGPYSRRVKQHQESKGLTDSQAHWMAIKSTEIMGVLLCELIPIAVPIRTPVYIPEKEIKVIFPFEFLKERNLLPHSWNATSDAIATIIGEDLGISNLLKLTAGPKSQELALDLFSLNFQAERKIKWTIISTQELDFLSRLKEVLTRKIS